MSITEIDIQADLNAVNDQITKMVEELNKLTSMRDQLMQQIQNMNGVAMYLRGKLPPEEQQSTLTNEMAASEQVQETESEDITRTVEYPTNE